MGGSVQFNTILKSFDPVMIQLIKYNRSVKLRVTVYEKMN